MLKRLHLLFFALFLCSALQAVDMQDYIENVLAEGITVDLREPEWCEGVIKTEQGGVITGPDIRIQARRIIYTRIKREGQNEIHVEAEDEIIIQFGEYVIVGSRLEYDFVTKRGIIYGGRTASGPWNFGGESIELRPDGSLIIHHGYVTTSENIKPEWQISAQCASLTEDNFLSAKNVQFRIFHIPVLWIPSFQVNLDAIFDHPIRYEIQGGSLGPRISLAYELFSWRNLKTFLRLDYRQIRGFGGGIETKYRSSDRKEYCETINYFAHDLSAAERHEKYRYRFQGLYHNSFESDKITLDIIYDKISDIDMPSDYSDRSLAIDYAGRTQLLIRRQEPFWITNFLTRVRINNFQTIKQELPTFETHFIPFEIASTGIISQNQIKLSYLDFVYANNLENVHDYSSSRLEFRHNLYRPFHLGPIIATPEWGGVAIFEGNSPEKRPRWVGLGLFSFQLETRLSRQYGKRKHVIRPFLKYDYFTSPTTPPNDHFIFDINDGWYRLNMLRLGVAQNFYFKEPCQFLGRYLVFDLWANAFFDTNKIPRTIPILYSHVVWNSTTNLKHTIDTAWDFQHNELEHLNFKIDWTVSQAFAISSEFRHRNAWDWRKADHFNFFLDAFRSIKELRHSALSDRRDTLLVHFYYHFLPTWTIEFESRHGWDRFREPPYNEFAINLATTLRSAWNFRLSYSHKEDEDRVAIYFTLGLKRPSTSTCNDQVPFLEF